MKRSFLTEASTDFENDLELEFSDSSSNELEERDNEFEFEDQELEHVQNEYESIESEFETDDLEMEDSNYEYENADNESGNWLNSEYDGRENEYENRIYAALSGEYESSYEMEQEIDNVLRDMEIEYFWNPIKKAKSFLKKHKDKILKAAGSFLPAGTLQNIVKLAGGDLRGLLKSDLFKKGLSFAANAVAPGVGGALASGLLNSEVGSVNNARTQAKQAVNVAKSAFQNMTQLLPSLQKGNIPKQISSFSKQALSGAMQRHSPYKGRTKKTVLIPPGSIVVVKQDRVNIYS